MKKVYASCIAFLLSLSLVACQKTPEQPLVKGKNLDQMMSEAGKNPVVAESGELLKVLNAPEKLTFQWEGKDKGLTVKADAKLIVPAVASMPVARVTKGKFSENDIKNLYDALRGNAKPISPDTGNTDSYYLQQIQQLQAMKASGKLDNKFSSIEAIDNEIRKLMDLAAAAPTDFKEVQPDFSFKQNNDTKKELPRGQYAKLMFLQPDNKTTSSIVVAQDNFGLGARAEYIRNWSDRNKLQNLSVNTRNTGNANALSMKQEDALKIAQDTVGKLKLSDFACTGKRIVSLGSDNKSAYEFMFTRTFQNAPITYTNDEGNAIPHEAYFKPWMYEKIRIFLDDEGVFYLVWNSPYVVKEIVSEASSMMHFTDIQGVFERMIGVKYDSWDHDERYLYEINITEARLGLMRITEQDVGDSGLVIPVWDFFGTVTSKGKPGKLNLPAEDTDNSYQYTSLITINAIDGSIIDRELGH